MAVADAAITTAKSQVIQAEASVEASKARIERLRANINDSALKSPRDGCVQYRIAQPGEVLYAGGKALNLVDIADVYTTFFLSTAREGKIFGFLGSSGCGKTTTMKMLTGQ
ncbi:Ribosome-associated ATPase [uncultured bacterium]|nr:Ribosome-associated ATPase [uncultured bacterium]